MSKRQNQDSGFDIADLTHKSEAEAIPAKASPLSKNESNTRLFLISNELGNAETIPGGGEEKKRPKKPTCNRKHIIFDSELEHNGNIYQVNTKKSGLYVELIVKIIEQYEIAVRKWRRVFVLRFDLHQSFYRDDSKHITNFRKRLFQKLKREYDFDEIGYCWVREQERSKAQHYHWVLFLDGNKIKHSSRIRKMIIQAWDQPNGAYHSPTIKHPFHFVASHVETLEAIYRVSYLAKARGKGYRPPQAKDYACSRMN